MTINPLEQFREERALEIKEIAVRYIEAILSFQDYEKGNLHWKFSEPLCAYVKGRPYDKYEDAGLLLFLHNQTQQITGWLDDKIGFKVENKFRKRPRHEIEEYANKLTLELCKFVLTLFPRPDVVTAFKDKEPKPTKLNAPVRGMS